MVKGYSYNLTCETCCKKSNTEKGAHNHKMVCLQRVSKNKEGKDSWPLKVDGVAFCRICPIHLVFSTVEELKYHLNQYHWQITHEEARRFGYSARLIKEEYGKNIGTRIKNRAIAKTGSHLRAITIKRRAGVPPLNQWRHSTEPVKKANWGYGLKGLYTYDAS